MLLTCIECKYHAAQHTVEILNFCRISANLCSTSVKNFQFICQNVPCTISLAFNQINKFYLHFLDMETVQEEVICLVSGKLRMKPKFLLVVPYSLNGTIFLK